MTHFLKLFLLTILFLLPQTQVLASEPPSVLATIKPVHSIVSSIMKGVARPGLLLSRDQSPHHVSLKPSERRLLNRADIIFWIGPGMEKFMPRLLNTLDKNSHNFALINTESLVLHTARTPDHHHSHDHDHASSQTDAHIWLNTKNAELIANEITQQLSMLDKKNASTYENNRKAFIASIRKLRNEINSLLKHNNKPFITYHDGYQYFEHEFGLNNAGFISYDPEIPVSARRITTLKSTIREKSIQCVFYDAPTMPPLIASLKDNSPAIAIELDATGINTSSGETALFSILQNMANSFHQCLKTGE